MTNVENAANDVDIEWQSASIANVFKNLGTSANGLSQSEIGERHLTHKPLRNQSCVAFAGTFVTSGHGKCFY